MPEPRTPRLVEMLAFPIIATAAAVLIFAAGRGTWERTWLVAAGAAAAAILIGWPLVFWLFDQGRIRLRPFVLAGACLGALPLVFALVSGVIGLFLRSGDLRLVERALGSGAPIPAYGVLGWPAFARFEMLALVSGLATAVIFFLVIRRRTPVSST
jgi:hypothetical protein